jgi:HSP20 family protein
MADLVKKPVNQPLAVAEWDPFRAMRDLLRWDPFREMAPVPPMFERMTFAPTFDVIENKDAYVFRADVPGVKAEDIEITTQGNRIQIAGKRDHEAETKADTVYTYERQYGNFTRAFTLPEGTDIELAKSALENGVLTLVVPKKPHAVAKKIEVTTGRAKS